MKQSGFSLVELSIVLVILGLLTGGILSGQSLIRASELRAAIAEYQRYSTAAQGFRDKYFAIPGDMRNATAFWGYTGGTGCTNSSGTAATTPGTCDGDGDGSLILAAGVLGQSNEMFQFWRQLALAGMIEGSYSGNAGPNAGAAGYDAVFGTNVPKSKMSNSGWAVEALVSPFPGDNGSFPGNIGNFFLFGGPDPGNPPAGVNLKPEEAWNIDTKFDDGKPGTGKVMAYNRLTCTSDTDPTAPTPAIAAAATYTLSSTSIGCSLWFINAF